MVRGWVANLSGFAGRKARPRKADVPESAYVRGGVEPPIADVLDDPIIQLIMRSDRSTGNDVYRAASIARR